jgi:hypothetical protein
MGWGTHTFGVSSADSHSQYTLTQSLMASCSERGSDSPKHRTSMHHCTSLSVTKGLGSGGWLIPKLLASCRTTPKVTSLLATKPNFSNTLWFSSPLFWSTRLSEVHSEYIPLFSLLSFKFIRLNSPKFISTFYLHTVNKQLSILFYFKTPWGCQRKHFFQTSNTCQMSNITLNIYLRLYNKLVHIMLLYLFILCLLSLLYNMKNQNIDSFGVYTRTKFKFWQDVPTTIPT